MVQFQKLQVHKDFEIVDVLHRVCDQDVSGQVTCFFAQHSFFNVEILHVALPLVENLHVEVLKVVILQVGLPLVEVQRSFVQILIIELVLLDDVLLDLPLHRTSL